MSGRPARSRLVPIAETMAPEALGEVSGWPRTRWPAAQRPASRAASRTCPHGHV
ncbi:hypothetical protein [Nannocystis pusilla]|uniref:hypothetical protein n=1 Tax=Nannocystis pusilla TaxID=889268 RepID=UPI003B8163AB